MRRRAGELMGKILVSQVNLGFIELPNELARCELKEVRNEQMEKI